MEGSEAEDVNRARHAGPDAPLVFVGRLSEDDVVHIRRYHDLLILGRPVRWLVGALLTMLAALAVGWTLAWEEFAWYSWLISLA